MGDHSSSRHGLLGAGTTRAASSGVRGVAGRSMSRSASVCVPTETPVALTGAGTAWNTADEGVVVLRGSALLVAANRGGEFRGNMAGRDEAAQ